ncbi:AAA family ATPase [Pantoea agglomerans]|uniref:AAA family ATPase n=3 Tax=Enterobacter agglomerans TaxID=549 RepID=UPI001CA39B6F|nr:AAA family ATPase [Pantoea agglomerans]
MYIRKIHLENIKSFRNFIWHLEDDENPVGWHVILGDNGSGKSTFIKSASLALLGTTDANRTKVPFGEWVKQGSSAGFIRLEIEHTKIDSWSGKGKQQTENLKFSLKLTPNGELTHHGNPSPTRHVWGGKTGWFSAAYGPYRRFTGGSSDYQKLFYSAPLLARHLSVFGEDIALSETLDWLKDLKFKSLETKGARQSELLKNIITFINQDDLLPNSVKLKEVTSDGITFIDSFGNIVDINSLSDGYRTILSMMLELIRQMIICYDTDAIFTPDLTKVIKPGVVFIDEIDVHLHPKWQRTIGKWLTSHFPEIQFIVSTHSALICQSAKPGSIWKLPSPHNSGERITGNSFNRLIYGDLLEAISTGAFGNEIKRSDDAKSLIEELASLNIKAMVQDLNEAEKERRTYLQAIFGSNSNLTSKG